MTLPWEIVCGFVRCGRPSPLALFAFWRIPRRLGFDTYHITEIFSTRIAFRGFYLGTFVFASYHKARGQMRYSNRRVGLVDMLAQRRRFYRCLFLKVFFVDFHHHIVGFGQDRDDYRGCVRSARGFPVSGTAGLYGRRFQTSFWNTFRLMAKTRFLYSAFFGGIHRNIFHFPILFGGVHLIHAHKVAPKSPASSPPTPALISMMTFFVVFVRRQQHNLEFFLNFTIFSSASSN